MEVTPVKAVKAALPPCDLTAGESFSKFAQLT